jgi:hypothetical protein
VSGECAVADTDLAISLLTIEVLIPWARSLKDKRSAVRGLKDRLRSRFNVSVAEVSFQDKWQRWNRTWPGCVSCAKKPRTCRLLTCISSGCSDKARQLTLFFAIGKQLALTA